MVSSIHVFDPDDTVKAIESQIKNTKLMKKENRNKFNYGVMHDLMNYSGMAV